MGTSTKTVPTTSSTTQSVQIPAYLQQAGQSAVDKATAISNTPYTPYTGQLVAPLSDNQNSAVKGAANSTGVGSGALGVADSALGAAGTTAANDTGAGSGALAGAQALYNTTGSQALNSQNAGQDNAAKDSVLSDIAGVGAINSSGAGQSDLDAARAYTAGSTAPITGSDIAGYFNPYVQQALDPVIANLNTTAAQNKNAIDTKAAMSGSFGGARSGLEEAQNQKDLLTQIAGVTGTGYLNAYNNAEQMATDALNRKAAAANTSNATAAGANTAANDAVSRLIQAAGAQGSAGTTASDLATQAQNRTSQAGADQVSLANAQSQLSTDDVNRLLSLVTPSNQTATTESSVTNDALNRLLTTGALEQTEGQNVDNANYQQFQNQQNWSVQQLNALLAAAGGVPYGTNTNATTNQQTIVQSPSILGQIIGGIGSAAGAFAASNEDWKQDFAAVDGEDILARLRRLDVETYTYKPEVRELIGDDGRRRVGPMAQDWAREFGGNPNIIPMPEIVGALVGAVQALERRTAPNSNDNEGALVA
jgi:Chaperone of endosialidase